MNGHKAKQLRSELYEAWLKVTDPRKLPFKSVWRRRKRAYTRGLKKLLVDI